MKLNYNWMALLCVGLSVPLVYHLATRNQRGGRPSVRFASYNLALNRPEEIHRHEGSEGVEET